jgi:hypothetical protein
MTSKQRRPAGITLLAIASIYAACGSMIAASIMMILGGAKLFDQFVGGVIHSQALLRIGSFLAFALWLLLCATQAAIGFGLWRLQNWARKGHIGLAAFCYGIAILSLPFLKAPWQFYIAFAGGLAVALAWEVWYLMRPGVRYAFGDWPSASGPPPRLSRVGRAYVVLALIASFAAFSSSLMFDVESSFRNSPIYALALGQAQNSPCVGSFLGAPLTPEWAIEGNMTEGSVDGSADLEIPLHGPKGKGKLAVQAKKQKGVWEINSLILERGSEQIKILPAGSASSCQ